MKTQSILTLLQNNRQGGATEALIVQAQIIAAKKTDLPIILFATREIADLAYRRATQMPGNLLGHESFLTVTGSHDLCRGRTVVLLVDATALMSVVSELDYITDARKSAEEDCARMKAKLDAIKSILG